MYVVRPLHQICWWPLRFWWPSVKCAFEVMHSFDRMQQSINERTRKKPRQIYEVFLWFSTPDLNTAAVCIRCVLAIFWDFKIFYCLLMEAKIVKFINFKSNSFIYKSSWYVWFGSSYRYSKWYSLQIFNKGFFLEPIDFGYNSQFYSSFNPFLSLQMGFWRLQQITTYVIVS